VISSGPPQQLSLDSLRGVLDSVFAAPAYRWAPRADAPAQLLRWWFDLTRWLGQLSERAPLLYWSVVAILVAILVVIFVHAGYVLLQTFRAAGAPPELDTAPPPLLRGPAWYRRQAEALAAAGRYGEAMSAGFTALVLELDARKLLRFHPGKTPNEYTYEARLNDSSREAFRELVRALYRHVFAGDPCGPAEFVAWQERTVAARYAAAN
jgi:hypothetical protein